MAGTWRGPSGTLPTWIPNWPPGCSAGPGSRSSIRSAVRTARLCSGLRCRLRPARDRLISLPPFWAGACDARQVGDLAVGGHRKAEAGASGVTGRLGLSVGRLVLRGFEPAVKLRGPAPRLDQLALGLALHPACPAQG